MFWSRIPFILLAAGYAYILYNIDWGQGLKKLKTWLESNAAGKTVHLGYFGSFPRSSGSYRMP